MTNKVISDEERNEKLKKKAQDDTSTDNKVDSKEG